jgi:hypothetical protein
MPIEKEEHITVVTQRFQTQHHDHLTTISPPCNSHDGAFTCWTCGTVLIRLKKSLKFVALNLEMRPSTDGLVTSK